MGIEFQGNVNNNHGIFGARPKNTTPENQKIEINFDNKFKVESGEELLTATPASAYGKALALSGSKPKDLAAKNISLADATKELHTLFDTETGIVSYAKRVFTPEDRKQYLEMMSMAFPYKQISDEMTGLA